MEEHSRKKKYSIKTILYRSLSVDDPELYKDVAFGNIEAVKEIYRRKKVKFFFKDIAVYTSSNTYSIKKYMYIQMTHPSHISIQFTDKELQTYNKKYTFHDSVINDDKFTQLTMNRVGKLGKSLQKQLFVNTQGVWDNLIVDCRQDINFNDSYIRFSPYLHAIYICDANADHNSNNITEPFDILDVDNYQALDNNAICYKHIDYVVNKEAKTFADIFTFVEANENIESNLKSNSCYFNIIISTYKESMERVMKNGKRAYRDLTPEYLCQIMEVENKDQDLGLSIRASLNSFKSFI